MLIKKSGKTVYGASLTAAEKKAMDIEIQRQLADYLRKHELEIDAIILWELKEQLGFGEKRLKRFYKKFSPNIAALVKRYELEEDDAPWICTKKLEDCGFNFKEWSKV